MILIEVTGAIDAIGTTKTFYLSTDPFTSTPADTPANTMFDAVLTDPGSYGIHAFSDGRTGGGTSLQTGEILLINNDGRFDAWKDYSFDGRRVVIRLGNPYAGYPGGTIVLFSGTVESVDVTWTQAVIRLKDNQFVFQVPLLPNAYLGTNVLPNGIEGTVNDIKGQKKPRVYGKVYNISPPCVNTSLLIYQLSDRALQSVDAVYDRGAAITAGADFATNALLQAATGITAGTYITCKAEGLMRLASSPAGTITCDATEGATSADRSASQILRRMSTDAGVTAISGSDTTLMDFYNSSEVGIWVTDTTTFASAMDEIANSVGAAYFFDGAATLRMAILAYPGAEVPLLSLAEHQILNFERVTARDNAIPPWAVTVNYAKVYTVQDTDIAGAVTPAVRAFLAQERRSIRQEDASIKIKYLLASEVFRDTLLADKTGTSATAEAARLLNLFKVAPNMYEVTVPLDIIQGASPPMLCVVSLTLNRFGLAAGKSFRLIGLDMELAANQALLTIWG